MAENMYRGCRIEEDQQGGLVVYAPSGVRIPGLTGRFKNEVRGLIDMWFEKGDVLPTVPSTEAHQFKVGDKVLSKLHRDEKKSRAMVVIKVTSAGRVMVRGKGDRVMTFYPHMLLHANPMDASGREITWSVRVAHPGNEGLKEYFVHGGSDDAAAQFILRKIRLREIPSGEVYNVGIAREGLAYSPMPQNAMANPVGFKAPDPIGSGGGGSKYFSGSSWSAPEKKEARFKLVKVLNLKGATVLIRKDMEPKSPREEASYEGSKPEHQRHVLGEMVTMDIANAEKDSAMPQELKKSDDDFFASDEWMKATIPQQENILRTKFSAHVIVPVFQKGGGAGYLTVNRNDKVAKILNTLVGFIFAQKDKILTFYKVKSLSAKIERLAHEQLIKEVTEWDFYNRGDNYSVVVGYPCPTCHQDVTNSTTNRIYGLALAEAEGERLAKSYSMNKHLLKWGKIRAEQDRLRQKEIADKLKAKATAEKFPSRTRPYGAGAFSMYAGYGDWGGGSDMDDFGGWFKQEEAGKSAKASAQSFMSPKVVYQSPSSTGGIPFGKRGLNAQDFADLESMVNKYATTTAGRVIVRSYLLTGAKEADVLNQFAFTVEAESELKAAHARFDVSTRAQGKTAELTPRRHLLADLRKIAIEYSTTISEENRLMYYFVNGEGMNHETEAEILDEFAAASPLGLASATRMVLRGARARYLSEGKKTPTAATLPEIETDPEMKAYEDIMNAAEKDTDVPPIDVVPRGVLEPDDDA